MYFLRTWIVFAGLVSSCTIVSAREWELKGNRFNAELIDLDGQIARFQESDGRIVGHHESMLSDTDRKVIAEWRATELRELSTDEIGVKVFPYWEKIQYVNQASPPEIVLVVLLKVHGREAATATEMRDLNLEALADDGTRLELSKQTSGSGEAIRLARYGESEQPSWGFKLKLMWIAPEKPLASLRLSGSLKMITGTPKSFMIDRLGEQKNRAVQSSLLDQAGLKMIENPWPRSSGFFFPDAKVQPTTYALTANGPTAHVHSVEMLDAAGQLISGSSGRSFVGNSWHDKVSDTRTESGTYQFDFYQPLPKNPKLRVTVLTKPGEVTFPFEFAEIAIPKSRPMFEDKVSD